jgi:gamma-glutamyl hercynylcysteine S-oxide synthase
MAISAQDPSTSDPASVTAAIEALSEARARTLALVGALDEDSLERVHSPLMSPLVWDLAHIAAYEDLWLCHRHGGLALCRPELAAMYDAFETPRAVRGEIPLLGAAQALAYMRQVRERSVQALLANGLGDSSAFELVRRHELQHTETMRQTMAIAGLLADGEGVLEAMDGEQGWVAVPAGAFEMGAAATGFAYDNERPAHMRHTGAFHIARLPVNNASWLAFCAEGGYERRELWSEEGWAWLRQNDIAAHPLIAGADPLAAVCHVSFFEAEAFARAAGGRLPSEPEWEKAARSEPPLLHSLGAVWEWTASEFSGYEGFAAYPYREYSEVFFDRGYRVLRGGSWASSETVATRTFRNWDLPQRRQIFAGLRLARDA